jgi:hypothetical protein
MRSPLRARFLLAALAVHTLLYLLLGFRHRDTLASATRRPPIELEILAPQADRGRISVSTVVPERGRISVSRVVGSTGTPRAPKTIETEIRPQSGSQSGSASGSQPERATTVESEIRPPLSLFPKGVMDGAAGAVEVPKWGGRRRHVGDGKAPPDTIDAEVERENVQRRVDDFLAAAAGQERVRSGMIAPSWRDVERKLRAGFKPGLEVVKERNVVASYLDQVKAVIGRGEDGLRKGVTPGSHEPESGIDRSFQGVYGVPEGSNYRAMPMQQALAAQAETGQPARWWTCEIEGVVDTDGTVVSVTVVVPSGRRKLDQSGQAAVRQALEAMGPPAEKKRMVSRWAVGAALQVSPPTAIGFGFDESLKTFDFVYPLKQRVLTRVSLISISAAR